MIRRRRNSTIVFLCFQAMAVAIICLGSLINFHQYKIWGKPLIPNFVGYKRDIEKYSKTLSYAKLSRDNQHAPQNFSGFDCEQHVGNHLVFSASGVLIFFAVNNNTPAPCRISSSGLRGPPVS
ncbi:MAG: hypothetical protein ACOYNC_01595 [Bacteroidales bacterium]